MPDCVTTLEKHVICKKLLWFLCIVYSTAGSNSHRGRAHLWLIEIYNDDLRFFDLLFLISPIIKGSVDLFSLGEGADGTRVRSHRPIQTPRLRPFVRYLWPFPILSLNKCTKNGTYAKRRHL